MITNTDIKTITSLAPGRTCLFGDHQDYLGLPVIACAIDRNIIITAKQNADEVFNIDMKDIRDHRFIAIHDTFSTLKPRDYFASSLRVLRRYGCIPTTGYDVEIKGNIPINSGTSSSSALLMAWIHFLIEAFGIAKKITPELLAVIGHESEVVEHNEPGGMMDHYSIGIGSIVYINTSKPYSYEIIGTKLDGLITGVSGVPKETVGLLSKVKGNTLESIRLVSEAHPDFDLHSVTLDEIPKYKLCLPTVSIPYFEAAIKNHQYTKEALKEFKKPSLDLKNIGNIMNQHHQVLRDLLQVTVPKIDVMIEAALEAGAYGAKILGSGGGGSIVVIAEPGNEQEVIDAIKKSGARDAYGVSVDPGARIL